MQSLMGQLRQFLPSEEEENNARHHVDSLAERVKAEFEGSFKKEKEVVLSSADDRTLSDEQVEMWKQVLSDFVDARLLFWLTLRNSESYFKNLSEREERNVVVLLSMQFIALQEQLYQAAAQLVGAKVAPFVPYFYIHVSLLPEKKFFEVMHNKKKLSLEWSKFLKKTGAVRAKGKRVPGRSKKEEYLIAHDFWIQKKRGGEPKYALPEIIRRTNRVRYGKVNFRTEEGKKILKRFRQAMRRADGQLPKKVSKRETKPKK